MKSSPLVPKAVLPSLDHLLISDFEHVYEPAEDTYLLCDALEQDKDYICNKHPDIAVEVGSGSGCVITFFAQMAKQQGLQTRCIATDINPHAVNVTRRTAEANKVAVEVFNAKFVSEIECISGGSTNPPTDTPLLAQLQRSVDVLIFNPPYVPTPSEEIDGNGIEVSWAGGVDGREVIDNFLPLIDILLSDRGSCYIVLVQENKPKQLMDVLQRQFGLASQVVINCQARNEDLMIVRVDRVSM